MTQQALETRTTAEDAGEGTRVPAGRSWLDRYFHISRRGSTVAREVRGGVTTFMAMAYILLLNPLILSGKDAAGDTLSQKALITEAVLVGPVAFWVECGYQISRGLVAARRVVGFLRLEPLADTGTRGAPADAAFLHDPESGVRIRPGALTALACARPSDAATVLDRLG